MKHLMENWRRHLNEATAVPPEHMQAFKKTIADSKFWTMEHNVNKDVDLFTDTESGTPASKHLMEMLNDAAERLGTELYFFVSVTDEEEYALGPNSPYAGYPNNWFMRAAYQGPQKGVHVIWMLFRPLADDFEMEKLDSNKLVKTISQTLNHELVHYYQLKKQAANKGISDEEAWAELEKDPKQLPQDGEDRTYLSLHNEIDAYAHEAAEQLLDKHTPEEALSIIRNLSPRNLEQYSEVSSVIERYMDVFKGDPKTLDKFRKKLVKQIQSQSGMQEIFNNWRGFIDDVESERIFENHDHIINVLGIELPLTEGEQLVLTEEKKAEILKEQLLHENFLKSIAAGAKEAAGKVKALLIALYKILKDGSALEAFIKWLLSKVIRPIANQFRKAFQKMKQAGERAEQLAEKLSEMFEELLQKLQSMPSRWKTAMMGTTVALLLKWAYEKVSGLIDDAISGKIEDELVGWFQEKFVQLFGQDMLDKALQKITDIKTYLGWVGPIVGGVGFVADTLAPVTGRMNQDDIIQEAINLDIEVGDIILGGKYKNKRVEVKEIGEDELGQPTINGKPILKFRIEKFLPDEKKSKKTLDAEKEKDE